MSAVAVVAALCGMIQGLCGLAGSLLVYLCINHPETVFGGHRLNGDITKGNANSTQEIHPRNSTEGLGRLEQLQVLVRLSGDPDKDVIFCFAIVTGLFNLIWSVSSFVLLLRCAVRSTRLLWQWVLATISISLVHFVGAIYFAAKTGRHVLSFGEEEWVNNLDQSSQRFLQYGYPFVLLAVFSGGIVTWPINIMLSFLVKRKAEEYFFNQDKDSLVILNGNDCQNHVVTDKAPSSAGSSRDDAVYVNQSFSPDEKY